MHPPSYVNDSDIGERQVLRKSILTAVRPFQRGQLGVLFFSRGRGFGHAIPDMAIADELSKREPDIDIQFVSYSNGAVALREHARPVIDLKLPDQNQPWVVTVLAWRLIGHLKPDIVMSHEEFAAIPAAKFFKVPTVFITEWFSNPGDIAMQSLAYADDVIVIEESGIFEEPPCVTDKVFYAGAVLRSFSYRKEDRQRARRELGLPLGAVVVLVSPGGWSTEQREPIMDLVLHGFDSIDSSNKVLVWITGDSYLAIAERCANRSDIVLK